MIQQNKEPISSEMTQPQAYQIDE